MGAFESAAWTSAICVTLNITESQVIYLVVVHTNVSTRIVYEKYIVLTTKKNIFVIILYFTFMYNFEMFVRIMNIKKNLM